MATVDAEAQSRWEDGSAAKGESFIELLKSEKCPTSLESGKERFRKGKSNQKAGRTREEYKTKLTALIVHGQREQIS